MSLGIFAFVIGILSLQWFNTLPSLIVLFFLPTPCLLIWRYPTARNLGICFLLGFYFQYAHVTLQLQKALPPALESTPILVSGKIKELSDMSDNGKRFLLTDVDVMMSKMPWQNPGDLQLYWYRNAPNMQEGECWQFTVRLKRPRHYANPGGFDYAKMLFFKRVVATGYVDTRAEAKLIAKERVFVAVRKKIQAHIHSVLPNSEMSPLIVALAVGLRDKVTQNQWDVLGKTGTNHLLAISGLHVGLVTGFIFFLLTRLIVFTRLIYYQPAQWFAALGAIIAAPLYGLLAGFSVPTQRAVIMVMVAMSFLLWRRLQNKWGGLAVSALLILLWDPFVANSASFWLSFLAVGVIFLFAQAQLSAAGIRKFLHNAVYLQWQISLGLVPITLVFFKTISWIGPIANFVAIPWVSFLVLPIILIALCVDLVLPAIGVYCWQLAALSLEALWLFLDKLAQIHFSSTIFVPQTPFTWAAIILAILLLMLPRAFPARWLALILIAAIYWQQPLQPKRGEVWASVLDVGQGLAVVIKTHAHTLLFDAGTKSVTSDSGKNVILPYLQSQGWDHIDTLILSHNHADHTGGAKTLIEAFLPQVLVGETIANVSSEFCRVGKTWVWDDVQFEILYPFNDLQAQKANSNDLSCVLKITTGPHSLLIPGDIEHEAERMLVNYYGEGLAATALVVPHHGSLTSSSEHFLTNVAPRYAFFTTGYRNRFGFPKREIVLRYQILGTTLYDTARDGAILLKFNASEFFEPTTYRAQNTYWWH